MTGCFDHCPRFPPSPLCAPRSLDNTSHKVRWSLDLRWQDAAQPEGNFGLKPAILLARAGDPADFVIDWDSWAHLDKKSGSADGLKAVDQAAGGCWFFSGVQVCVNPETVNPEP